ncbi:hypothetical protein B0H12DRAFT_1326143 [Mycena haematopus]|nr:hypothetical protein B0H12DRAFT_1326143 [Mycena haematopus]
MSSDPTDYDFVVPGAILMDGLLHSFCLGFVLALGLKYWEEYAQDSIPKRAFVLTVVLLSSLQTVFLDYKVWSVAIYHKSWASGPFVWADFFLNGTICSMCEAFYIQRCWKMTGRSPWALYPMVSLWLSGVGAQFYITITLGLEFHSFTVNQILGANLEDLFRNTMIVFSYWVIVCLVLDVTVATILITCLFKSKTGLDTSNSVVNRVILLTLETALLPSISMAVAVIILHGTPNPGEHDDLVMFFVFITAKLYAIGLLRTLNARVRLRERLQSTDLGRTSLANWTWDQDPPNQGAAAAGKPDPGVQQLSIDPATIVRRSIASSTPTYTSQVQYQGVAPDELEVLGSPATPSLSQHVHFSSPLLDQHERGLHPGPRLRAFSLHRTKSPNHETA